MRTLNASEINEVSGGRTYLNGYEAAGLIIGLTSFAAGFATVGPIIGVIAAASAGGIAIAQGVADWEDDDS